MAVSGTRSTAKKWERPHTSIDPEAHWSKSGCHALVSGWKLHLVSVKAGVWFPIAAMLTPAHLADSDLVPALLAEVPAEVRRVFHQLRSHLIENLNEHFKGIFNEHGQVPTKGLIATQRFALRAIFVSHLTLTSPL